MEDLINHPKHYTQYQHEVIELTERFGFNIGNCIKYICRAPFKGKTVDDYKKALWYLDRWWNRGDYDYMDRDDYIVAMNLAATFDIPILLRIIALATSHNVSFDSDEETTYRAIREWLILRAQDAEKA